MPTYDSRGETELAKDFVLALMRRGVPLFRIQAALAHEGRMAQIAQLLGAERTVTDGPQAAWTPLNAVIDQGDAGATRTLNVLLGEGVENLEELALFSREEAANFPGMGPRLLERAHDAMMRHGVTFRHDKTSSRQASERLYGSPLGVPLRLILHGRRNYLPRLARLNVTTTPSMLRFSRKKLLGYQTIFRNSEIRVIENELFKYGLNLAKE